MAEAKKDTKTVMATLPTLDSQSRVASDAAQKFVESYYSSLNKRQPLAQYYASVSPLLAAASVKPDISINGRVVETPDEYETMLDEQGKLVHYDVRSYDAQPVNGNYSLGCPEVLKLPDDPLAPSRAKLAKAIKDGERVSFIVQVTGVVRYGKPSETLIGASTDSAGKTAATATAAATAAGSSSAAESSSAGKSAAATTAAGSTVAGSTVAAGSTAAESSATGSTTVAEEKKEDPAAPAEPFERAFNEAWFLVPHWEALGRNAPRGLRPWVVVSQNYRSF